MTDVLDIRTPAQAQAEALRSEYGLESLGLVNLRRVYWNLPAEALYEEIVFRGEASLTRGGALVASTGRHTGRSVDDKALVREPSTEDEIWWGEYNRPLATEQFDGVVQRLQGFLQGRDVFVQDCFVGADPAYRLPIRIVTELAWHSLFARNMFLPPASAEEHRRHVPEFTLIAVPAFRVSPQIDATRAETAIALSLAQRLCLVGNTAYAGEIKKSIFTVLNYLLPAQGVLPMHCAANVGEAGDTALFFGLSGTGKTALSADPERRLIGDDEHGWSDDGVFNFEGGCYAKVIRLSPRAEPQIYACTERFGTILENVAYDPATRRVDLDDDSTTENTRASYPLDYIENAVPEKRAGHPAHIVLLTCDASGVMPPIARLTAEQAIYQFVSGYTAKVAGTEAGGREEPEITFSTCFGAPFIVRPPASYAELLRRKILRHEVSCWLLNTGWVGGPYGVGSRIAIGHTRALLRAVLSGALDGVEYTVDPVFGFEVPRTCEGVPAEILDPAGSWQSRDVYMEHYQQLGARFADNFRKFEADCPPEIARAGPRIRSG